MEQPNFYAILTADVRYDKLLSPLEKLLYAEITALSNKEGYCRASNKYFAELFDRNEKYISGVLHKLEKRGRLKIDIDKNAGNSRKIWIAIQRNLNTPIQKNLNSYSEKPEHNTINNTIPKNTINNISSKEETSANALESVKEEFGNKDINSLIEHIDRSLNAIGKIYVPAKKERWYAKNLLSKSFSEKIKQFDMTLYDFVAKIIALTNQPYVKQCNNCEKLYYNRGEVLNGTRMKQQAKQETERPFYNLNS